jgi:periplasmic protein TonB
MLDDANHRVHSIHAWLLSVAVHTLGIALVVLMGANLPVNPPSAPFRWDVMVVEPSASATHESEMPAWQTSTADIPLLRHKSDAPAPQRSMRQAPSPERPQPPKESKPLVHESQTMVKAEPASHPSTSDHGGEDVGSPAQRPDVIEPPLPKRDMIEDFPHAETTTSQKARVPAEDQTPIIEEAQVASTPLAAEEVVPDASTEQMAQQGKLPTPEAATRSQDVPDRPTVPDHATPVKQPLGKEPVSENRGSRDADVQPSLQASSETVMMQPSITENMNRSPSAPREDDYGWLTHALWTKVEQLKRYPSIAKMNRWEGKVVLRAVIRDDGHVSELEIAQSSGHAVLDRDAVNVLKKASPLSLARPLGQPEVVIHIPIHYQLR